MKKKGKVTLPGLHITKAKAIEFAALKAAKRLERYDFKRSVKFDTLLSHEMQTNLVNRFEVYDREKTQWRDRHYLIAAPLTADVFLNCDGATPATILGAPRFFHDDYIVHGKPPQANKRFPYSDEAKRAAKKIAFALHQRVMLRNWSAGIIQRFYRRYKLRVKFQKAAILVQQSANRIKFLLQRRRFRMRQAKVDRERALGSAVKIQALWRGALTRMHVLPGGCTIHQVICNRAAKKLQRWIRKWLWMKRKRRGQRRRRGVHAVRIQALWRGYRVRRNLNKAAKAKNTLTAAFRKRQRKNKLPMMIKVMTAMRRWRRYRVAVRIQRVVRGFIGRRRFHRKRLKTLSDERLRFASENLDIKHAVIEFCNFDKRWYSAFQSHKIFRTEAPDPSVPGTTYSMATLQGLMVHLDKITSELFNIKTINKSEQSKSQLAMFPAVPMILATKLNASQSPPKSSSNISALDATASTLADRLGINVDTMTYRERTGLAILLCFSCYPQMSIDKTGLELCRPYFKYIYSDENKHDDGSDKKTGRLFSFNNIGHMHSIPELLEDIQVNRSLMWQIKLQGGRLPEEILSRGALYRKWHSTLSETLRRRILAFRESHPLKYHCAHCLEPLIWEHHKRAHGPTCARNHALSWVNKELMRPARDMLLSVLQSTVKPVPRIDRSNPCYVATVPDYGALVSAVVPVKSVVESDDSTAITESANLKAGSDQVDSQQQVQLQSAPIASQQSTSARVLVDEANANEGSEYEDD